MTDAPQPPAFDADDFTARYNAYEQRAAALVPANKANLFSALGDAGITCVTVTFDGYGDSGQIENIEAKAGEEIADLPDTLVEIARTEFYSDEIHRRTQSLPEAIESICYLILEAKHGGWENNEGAYGEFSFDVAANTIRLDYNERVETTEFSGHEW